MGEQQAPSLRVRIDKWLWAARFFKTRALASRACELGRVHVGDLQAKASREVKPGDMVRVRTEGNHEFHVEVLALSQMRGSAAVAQTMYRETDESKAARAKATEERRAMALADDLPDGKLSKRNRREFERIRYNNW